MSVMYQTIAPAVTDKSRSAWLSGSGRQIAHQSANTSTPPPTTLTKPQFQDKYRCRHFLFRAFQLSAQNGRAVINSPRLNYEQGEGLPGCRNN